MSRGDDDTRRHMTEERLAASSECDDCGALIADSLRHEIFHDNLRGDGW